MNIKKLLLDFVESGGGGVGDVFHIVG